jgi:plastocyanin
MRRLLAPTILCAPLLVATASAPAATRTVGIAAFEFRPDRVVIAVDDVVRWRWRGPETDHSVTARPNQAQTFDSDPGLLVGAIQHPVGFVFQETFSRPGTYRYFCKVHPSMRGVVVVRTRIDQTAPVVRSLRVSPPVVCARRGCRRAKIRVRFGLSERARVVLRIVRIATSPGRERSRKLRARRGTNDFRVSTQGLAAGRYRLTLTATDASGNASNPATTSFRIRRAAAQSGWWRRQP